jgi:GT2 family glycosyltransferase
MTLKISASLVLFNSPREQFEVVIRDFLAASQDGMLHVADNSPQALESECFALPRVHYRHMAANIGFGAAHNVCIREACSGSDLHLLLNPDIHFEPHVLQRMADVFASDPTLVVAMPQIRYPDGKLQRLCKLLPTPMDLIVRRFLPVPVWRDRLNDRYELSALPQDRPSDVPTVSGCFMLMRSPAIAAIGGFDERFFMYMEDVDLVRRLGLAGAVRYLPDTHVVHEYAKGSYRSRKLLGYHLKSAVRYFNKWGWFVDRHRRRVNAACLRAVAK